MSMSAIDQISAHPCLFSVPSSEYAVTPNWTVGANARYFGITVDPYSGSIVNIDLSTTYSFEYFYFGAGYTWVDINVEIDESNWDGGLDWRFDGPHLFIGARF